jgi:hypothetical protein
MGIVHEKGVTNLATARRCGFGGIGGNLRRNRISRLHAAPNRTATRTAYCHLHFLAIFGLLHLTKAWAVVGMVPIVFGAGFLLGLLAWSSRSLIPAMVGHVVTDIGLFAYWWTGIAGTFSARPISETGVDGSFSLACTVFVITLLVLLVALSRLRKINLLEIAQSRGASAIVPGQ